MKARRRFLTAAVSLALLPCVARAAVDDLRENPVAPLDPRDPEILAVTKGATIRAGKVRLELPQLADNGNSVPIRITVDSPMTAADHVKSIHLYSERNPVSNMANFYLGPRAGKAEINSRVRLAGSQKVTAVAKLSDGSVWYDTAAIVVTLSACLDES